MASPVPLPGQPVVVVVKPEPEPPGDWEYAVVPDYYNNNNDNPRRNPDDGGSDRTERADGDSAGGRDYDSDRTENPYDDDNDNDNDGPEDRPPQEEEEANHEDQEEEGDGGDGEQKPAQPWDALAPPAPTPVKRGRGRPRSSTKKPPKPRPRQRRGPDERHKTDPLSDARVPEWPSGGDEAEPRRRRRRRKTTTTEPAAKRVGPKAKKASQAQDNHKFLVCARNYAAVDSRRETYGLIDQGLVDAGTRTMVMHVRRGLPAWDILGAVKPGTILSAKSQSGRGGSTPLRVRFTTPTRYYPPGCKFSTMTVGVDETDWQSLMAKARRI